MLNVKIVYISSVNHSRRDHDQEKYQNNDKVVHMYIIIEFYCSVNLIGKNNTISGGIATG